MAMADWERDTAVRRAVQRDISKRLKIDHDAVRVCMCVYVRAMSGVWNRVQP